MGPPTHATSVSPTTNRRKFGGKELATDLGLNLHDFAARWQNPALGRFTTPDPLLEKYRDISPYLFCAGDPINHIDPTGMTIDLSNLTNEQLKIWDSKISLMTETSELFSELYMYLIESLETYIITHVTKISGKNSDNSIACFIESESGGIIEVTDKIFNIEDQNINRIAEEAFHAFQSETNYGDYSVNREFEAKIFVMAFAREREMGASILDINEESLLYYHNIIEQNYKNNTHPLNQLRNPESQVFRQDFITHANNYVEYCKKNNISNSNYLVTTTGLPISLFKIYNILH